ncbi:MAG: nucleotidyl transferase [SAR86 cluster bacterium]|uniref:Nucleotidyl transferase n=1 Tax=SAR86 cluster bacterium TaxID=2030880 RepID=A0A2A4X4B8_9GAMM|nr:MAG: nucleotidyl transferase [SAR86 cluster bacterium]
MKIIILCGGKGIRAFPFTEYLPKPMLPVGGSPIIVQVVKNFIAQGYCDFILAAGYRQDVLVDYFDGKNLGANIEILDTGEETDTGGRVLACKEHLGEQFIVTYADGLCDVPIKKLVERHNKNDGLATITSVPLYSQYGVIDIDETNRITQLREKPVIDEHWINAGFIVFDKEVFDHWEGTNMEQHVFPSLVAKGLVHAYPHRGFFKSLDSYKDQIEFSELASITPPPWRVRED